MEIREYQVQAADAIMSALSNNVRHRLMYQLPTGGGKTHIANRVCVRWLQAHAGISQMDLNGNYIPYNSANIYWITHRRELERQSGEALSGWIGEDQFLVSSPIKFFNKIKRKEINPGPLDLLVIDESHHAVAPTWQRLIQDHPGPVLGLTATPWRMTKSEGFGHLFDELICGPTTKQLIADGYLVPALVKSPPGTKYIKGYGNIGGEYSSKEIMANNDRSVLIEGAIDWLIRETNESSRSLVYACSIEHCRELTHYCWERYKIKAAFITGETPLQERDAIIEGFNNGTYSILINHSIVTEGFDIPEADIAMILRPTRSLALYLQMVGRVIRRSSDKLYAVVLDAAGNFIRHGLPEDDRKWSLSPRGRSRQSEYSGGFYRSCIFCDAILPASVRQCPFCENQLGMKCNRCGKFSWWQKDDVIGDRECRICDAAKQALFMPPPTGSGEHILRPVLLNDHKIKGQVGVVYEGKDFPADLVAGEKITVKYVQKHKGKPRAIYIDDHIRQEIAKVYQEGKGEWKIIYTTWKGHQRWVMEQSLKGETIDAEEI